MPPGSWARLLHRLLLPIQHHRTVHALAWSRVHLRLAVLGIGRQYGQAVDASISRIANAALSRDVADMQLARWLVLDRPVRVGF